MKPALVLVLLALCLCACRQSNGDVLVAPRLAPGATSRAWPPQGWAWGVIRIAERPPQRYGVSGPAVASLGDIIILPGYGESAEWWFETARDLNHEGYTVWALDPEGQGGSGRFTPLRDLGHTPDFAGDIDGLNALIQTVVRPQEGRPVTVVASGTSALTALAAAELGTPMTSLILSSPSELSVESGGLPGAAASIGLTTLRASGGSPWRRGGQGAATTPRQKAALGWALANPDLRMGGPSTGWLRARRTLTAETLAPGALRRVAAPVVIITPQASGLITCRDLSRCLMRPLPARLPYHAEDDPTRAAWLAALIGELGTDHGA